MKIKNLIYVFTAVVMSPMAMHAQVTDVPSGYSLVWADEFNGTALNENAWTIEVSGTGGGNQELQYYIKDNVAVEDGNLVLTAKREEYDGFPCALQELSDHTVKVAQSRCSRIASTR